MPFFHNPTRTVVTSFQPHCQSYEEGVWCFHVAAPSTRETVAIALSNGDVQVYDATTLQCLSTLPPPPLHYNDHLQKFSCITSLTYHHPSTISGDTNYSTSGGFGSHSSMLWVTDNHGTVRLFDIRQALSTSAALVQLPLSGSVSTSSGAVAPMMPALQLRVGYDGTVVAIGSRRKIYFLDVRKLDNRNMSRTRAPASKDKDYWLGCYRDAHTDDVSCLTFISNRSRDGSSSSSNTMLMSGGEDGLVTLWDTTRACESEALEQQWNVGIPLRRLGAITTGGLLLIWCITGNESLSIWNPETSECFSFNNIRNQMSHDWNTEAHEPEQHQRHQHQQIQDPLIVDYLIDADWNESRNELLLSAGSANGSVGVFRWSNPSASRGSGSGDEEWETLHVLSGGHQGVVRDILFASPNHFFTVGEDSRLCEWCCNSRETAIKKEDGDLDGRTITLSGETKDTTTSTGSSVNGPFRSRPRSRPSTRPY